ncbi:TonB-dependent receptor [Phenylobacterium montanum]|uniref:TonB-dependent receptor n=1 Tax=Phenylobacterium montanum TaxID=2823693 RepID=A0A975IYA2_9CAUL|nr:TonB-dependent receptor [Caulobacter sp. S6]QUD90241.1 TonB-dependent receptor [Caulobacter sp. S6]
MELNSQARGLTRAALWGQTSIVALAMATCAGYATGANAQAAPKSEATQLGEIVVTAQRRSESILKTPVSITAVTGEALRASGANTASQLGDLVPNLQITKSVSLQISIRGVSNENSLQSGDPSAAFNVDGVYIARPQAQGAKFFDLERIEVLRGPQGTLYGRNATGGAINLIPNKPVDHLEASASAEIGNFNTFRTTAVINAPVNDFLDLRAAFASNKHDSYLVAGPATITGHNSRLGSDEDDVEARLQALIKFSPGVTLRISVDGANDTALPPMQVPVTNFFQGVNPIFGPGTWFDSSSKAQRTVNWDPSFTGRNSARDRGTLAEFNADLGFAALTYLGAYRSFKYYKDEPVYFLSLGEANRGQLFNNNESSHELRLASKPGRRLTWVAGLYRFQEHSTGVTEFLPPLPLPLTSPPYNYRLFYANAKADSTAVFGQATFSLTDSLRVTGGLRYTKDGKSSNSPTTSQVGPIYNPTTDISVANIASKSYSKVNWKAGLEYDVAPGVMLYGDVSTGYKAGGYNSGCLATTPGCNNVQTESALFYAPEELTAYEAGAKGRFFDNKVRASLTGFYYDYRNMQLQGISPATAQVTTTNAATATIYGAELEGVWAPTRVDKIDFALTLLHAKYDSYQINALTNWAGFDLDRSPSYSIMVGYNHTFDLPNGADVVAGIDTRANASSIISNFNAAVQYKMPSYTRTNVVLTYNSPEHQWYVQGYANNLEDNVRPGGIVLGAAFLSDPRTYGIRVGAKF